MSERKTLIGTVWSNKMQKTVVVAIKRRAVDPRHGRVITHVNRLKAHDEKGECRLGDEVLLMESRPISREKRWRVVRILKKGRGLEIGETAL